ncbi:Inosine-uridine preferring nucleoside hydrolase [Actinokineospora spheciospongiae]|uniref:Inosine-uridine preferring nucleoside hydrolase n=1 Tax=Actinokineospora spheciospongiae TaxID=909613 RepID=W7IZ99_9PSEU|nr:nucleoside hydrolase [Actinokineospora spheciospongiae]EWC61881.1 Inosine-uridine preferring nucleoside hydrolase [Actinokineospora spheciospongiae]PWW55443.1 pyrimidine-specific ribonucleoside hydrolase [Actinokineospora spheciospongiae]
MSRLIIDTDPGVDDAFALALAARSPEVDLLAVTTVFGNVGLEHTTRNALRVLALLGREDVPVGVGAARPLVHATPLRAAAVHGDDGLSGRSALLPQRSRGVEPEDAVALMARLITESPEPVTLVPIGPLTNIAALLAAHPGVKSNIDRVVIMGGGLTGGNVTAAAEFNLWCDPEAAHRVLVTEDLPTVLVPTDLTYQCAVDGDWLDRLAASGPLGAALEPLTEVYRAHYRQILGYDGTVIHDAVAVAEAIRPGILRTTPIPVHVDTAFGPRRGGLLADRRLIAPAVDPGFRTIEVALETDVEALRAFLLDRLT